MTTTEFSAQDLRWLHAMKVGPVDDRLDCVHDCERCHGPARICGIAEEATIGEQRNARRLAMAMLDWMTFGIGALVIAWVAR